MTLLEMTVVILFMLALITILFIGARAWKRGSDRTGCVTNIRNTQMGVRSYQNMRGLPAGATISVLTDVKGLRDIFRTPSAPVAGPTAISPIFPARANWPCGARSGTLESHVPENPTGW